MAPNGFCKKFMFFESGRCGLAVLLRLILKPGGNEWTSERRNEWASHRFRPGRYIVGKSKLEIRLKGTNLIKLKKWRNFFLLAVGFQNGVPKLCALQRNAYASYPVNKVCSFAHTDPLKRYTTFPNYLLDVQRTKDMGTSFFTPLWQIECTSLATTAMKENDNFLYPQKKVMSLSRCAGPPS